MLVALTVRKLKPGTLDQFKEAWGIDSAPPGWKSAYTVRNVNDETEVISFGFFEGTLEELRRSQVEFDYAGQRAKIDELVESTGTDGIFEVAIEQHA